MAADKTELHIGKRTEEAKTLVTPAMHDLLAERARAARCTPSDLLHDALYLVITGKTYAEHVANDRRAALALEGRDACDRSPGSEGDLQCPAV